MIEAFLAPLVILGGWYVLSRIPKSEQRRRQREDDVEQARSYLETCQAVILRSKGIAALVSRQAALPIEVVRLLFEVKLRELDGTANQMFSLRVSGLGGPSPLLFFGERKDPRTGKAKMVRKYAKLRLATSPEANGLFGVVTQPVRGGSVWKGLRLTEDGTIALSKIVRELREMADQAE